MAQPADNINSTTARHMSTTVIRLNDVFHYFTNMQTQSIESNDEDQPITQVSKHSIIVTDNIIHDQKNSSSDVSEPFK